MTDITTQITRKAFHFNDDFLDFFGLIKVLEKELDNQINIYDYELLDEIDPDAGSDFKVFTVYEMNRNDEGERECIRHDIPFGSWLVQMVDGSFEVMETPTVKDYLA